MSNVVVEEQTETETEAKQYSDITNMEQASVDEEQPVSEEEKLPEKFRGKSVESIVSSYENLEKELGRKGQEIGELRQLTDNILKQQLATPKNETKKETNRKSQKLVRETKLNPSSQKK